jgi:polyisoprenoid-binding protein YceI
LLLSLTPATHTLGPDNATLTVATKKGGAAAKAAHNLLIEVTSWQGTLVLGPETRIWLTADARSMRVRDGTGGMMALGDSDRASIEQSIDEEVLKGTTIAFESDSVQPSADGSRLNVSGRLELGGRHAPIAFELYVDDGKLTGSATVKQSDWGIKPYSTLFGTLKVLDEVQVGIDASLNGT